MGHHAPVILPHPTRSPRSPLYLELVAVGDPTNPIRRYIISLFAGLGPSTLLDSCVVLRLYARPFERPCLRPERLRDQGEMNGTFCCSEI